MSHPDTPSFPAIDVAWHDAMNRRISSRRFDGRALSPEESSRLGTLCEHLNAGADRARVTFVNHPPDDVFTGLVGGYGRIEGAPAYVVFSGQADAAADVGYLGEAVILDATVAGLETCWLAGMFDAEKTAAIVELSPEESVRAVTPVGHAERPRSAELLMRAFVRARKRIDLDRVAPGNSSWPAWACDAAEAVRIAPSGGNGQPWRLRMEDGALVVACKPEKPYPTWQIDCGIAMLHAELGAAHAQVVGTWEWMSGLDVARFMPETRG